MLAVLAAQRESQDAPFEIFFIDDGSVDGSSLILDRFASQDHRIRALHFDRNYGKTAALDSGFKHASGQVVIIMDGDLQTKPADIAVLLPHLAHYDVVCGRRAVRNDHLIRKISSRIGNAVRNAIIHDGMHDTGCGFMMFRRRVIETIPLFEGMHRFFPALALMHGFTVTEVPIPHYARLHGVAKYGVRNRLFKSMYDLMAVRWMQSRRLHYRLLPDQLPTSSTHLPPSSFVSSRAE